nr:hypothetical protein [Tanacetum cinerariifolium]
MFWYDKFSAITPIASRLTVACTNIPSNLGVYYFSTLKAPKKIISKLEGIRRKFFWGGSSDDNKISWIAWDKTISPRNKGGLGIGSLKASNHALLAKWWWRFLTEDNALWSKLKEDLITHGIDLPSIFNNYQSSSFWHDNWLGGSPLLETFPRLYRLDTNRNCHVSDRCPTVMFNTSSESFFGPTVSAMGLVHPPDLVFHWAWRRELHYAPEIAELGDMPIRWNKGLPFKVNILTWRVSNRRMPTRVNIDRRGIDIDSIRCPICDGDLESEDHLFVSCVISDKTWKNVLDWSGTSNVGINNLYDVINLADQVPLEPTWLFKHPCGPFGDLETTRLYLKNDRTNTFSSTRFLDQVAAIELYCEKKLKSHPDNLVGTFTMGATGFGSVVQSLSKIKFPIELLNFV